MHSDLTALGIKKSGTIHWNLTPEQLVEASIKDGSGVLADSGALMVKTGKFTGRSPEDRFIVKDDITTDTVDWGAINKPIDAKYFDILFDKIRKYVEDKELYVRDAYACSEEKYKLNLRVVAEYPWSNQFAFNMFNRLEESELEGFQPEWTVIDVPGFLADPTTDGTRQENFAIINFTQKVILVGGTAYTGEIKKGIFSVLNYILPMQHDVFSMHCSANVGEEGDTAVFFGLSGTGKTTLSADPTRKLIGDDEHGWSEDGVFNFEGGCYAKVIDLTEEKEPDIFRAIKHRAILENVTFIGDSRAVNFEDDSITPNTRVSYPIYHIDNIQPSQKGGHPKNVFFLTADAFGVLPPLSKLTPEQAMYYFILGYTAKVAGTEAGINEPQSVFSACFGAPFLPLHPVKYAEMLRERMEKHGVNIWLVNTGWTGGEYGVGSRIKLKYTRAMIGAALNHELDSVQYETHPVFGLQMPTTCPNVPDELLNPRNTWADKAQYDAKADHLASEFVKNFKQFEAQATPDIMSAAPKVSTEA